MSSTNKTTHYELSQFLGTDKPAWLNDYNSDMNKIDAGINTAQTTASGADGKATTNATAIGTLSNLTTEAQTNLVAAINEVDSHADTAQSSADNVGITANANSLKIADIQDYFKFTQFDNTTATATGASISANELKYASNAEGTLGKIYGRLVFTTSAGTINISFPTSLRPATTINVDGIVMWFDTTANSQTMVPVSIATDGTCTISMTSYAANRTVRILMPACLIFLQDFGD